MKRFKAFAGIAVLAVAALFFLGVLPSGTSKGTEICTDCGKTRFVHHVWIGSMDWNWETSAGTPEHTPVSRFLENTGAAPNPAHLWRPYRGALQPTRGAVLRFGPPEAEARAHAYLREEEALARLDRELAARAVRARLSQPQLDGLPGTDTARWFKGTGWPPATAEEAKAWWVANRP